MPGIDLEMSVRSPRAKRRPPERVGEVFSLQGTQLPSRSSVLFEGAPVQSDDPAVEKITVSVPKRRDISANQAMARLFAFLQAVDVDCKRDPSGTAITYGEDAEGAEGEFILSLIEIFDARLTAVPTAEE